MKRIVVLLFALVLAVSFAVSAGAAEITENSARVCEHSWNEGSVVPPTCTQAGEVTSICTLCNEVKTTPVDALGHSFDTIKSGDTSGHIAVCSNCGGEETRAHSWDAGTVTKAADCANAGEKTFTCGCGEKKTESIPALGHDYSAWTKSEKQHSRSCSRCETKETGNHTMTEEVVKEATCKETGSIKKTCSVCSFTVNEVVPKLTAHTYDNVCDPDCNACGETRNTKHNYGKSWSRDYTGHWHECTKCGEKTDFKQHYPGPAATEDEPQVCLTCDYVLVERLDHKHSAAKTWTSDEDGHWHECKSCDEQLDYKRHSYDDACDETCNICDYQNESAHDLTESWETTDKKHWKECSLCGEKVDLDNHTPGPEASEEQAQVCTICDYEIAPKVEHTHEFSDIWMYDGENHWKECSCGEKSVPFPHSWGEGTKGKGGSVTYTCSDCHTHKTEEGSGFPWWILILILVLLAGGGAAAYFFLIAPAKTEGSFLNTLSDQLTEEEPELLPEEPAREEPELDVDSILKEFSDI